MKNICMFIVLASMVMVSGLVGTATANAPFNKAFDEKYVKKCNNEEFSKVFKKAGCYTCHVKKKKKD